MTAGWTLTRLHIDHLVVDGVADDSRGLRPEVLEAALTAALRQRLEAAGSVVARVAERPVLHGSAPVDLSAGHGLELDAAVGRIAEVLLSTLRGEVSDA